DWVYLRRRSLCRRNTGVLRSGCGRDEVNLRLVLNSHSQTRSRAAKLGVPGLRVIIYLAKEGSTLESNNSGFHFCRIAEQSFINCWSRLCLSWRWRPPRASHLPSMASYKLKNGLIIHRIWDGIDDQTLRD